MGRDTIKLTESVLKRIIAEEVKKALLGEGADHERLIRQVLIGGEMYSTKNEEGYYIGTGYGCGRHKEFFYPYSSRMEHSDCFVETAEINRVVEKMESEGYEFKRWGDGYVRIKGSRDKTTWEFRPFKGSPLKEPSTTPNPRRDPVQYYSDRVFTTSKDGNLHLF